jgi:hypothetical protein
MPAAKDENTMSGLEKFNKNFLPYLLLAFGLIQYIYTSNQSEKQGILVEIRDEQRKARLDLNAILAHQMVSDVELAALKKEFDKLSARYEQLEQRQNNIEKSQILENGNHR